VLAINLMGSPGAGKTALLEATARAAGRTLRLAAVSGDLATDRDAARLVRAGVPAAAITTGSACHLDAGMVHAGLHDVAWRDVDVFVIENVGNLVCPAVYDLGQAANVVALSVTEGEDKPIKYPVMFRKADLVLLTKCDLLPYLDVDVAAIEDGLARVMPVPTMIRVSPKPGEGIAEWMAWLEARRPRVAALHGKPATLPGVAAVHAPHDHDHDHDRGHGHAHAHSHDDHHHGHGHGHGHG
jgi:hydrogenase nickel incorporation protein HypB